MGYFKLDKLDKIVIAFTFIIVTLSCIFNVYSKAFEFEVPEGYYKINQAKYLSNVIINDNGKVEFSGGSSLYRIELLNGANYIYLSSPHFFGYFLSNEDINIGDTVTSVSKQGAQTEVYLYNNGDYKYLYLFYYSDNNVDVYTNANAMTSAISDLSRIVDIKSIWSIFDKSIPYISIVVVFSLGVWFIKHNIIEHSKGRDF